MNPSSSDWIQKYFTLISNSNASPVEQFQETDVMFYHILQGTGLVFGYPGNFIYLDELYAKGWSGKERMKVLYLESFIFSWCFVNFKEPQDSKEEIIEDLLKYFEETEISTAKRNFLSFGKLHTEEKLELMIQQRLDFEFKIDKNIWISYFYNVLVFPDVYCYYKKLTDLQFDYGQKNRNWIIRSLLEVVAVASNSDEAIEAKEKSIFTLFLESAKLPDEDNDELMDLWENRDKVKDIAFDFGGEDYILKKYFLDIVVLTLWSDQVLDDEETVFLENFAQKLNFDQIERDSSLAVVKTFILTYQDEIPYLQTKNDLSKFYSGLTSNWGRILVRNKNRLAKELTQSRELVTLITISTTRELTKSERKKVRAQFRDLARSIPALTIFMLPGGAVLLPMILKIIPGLIPSAFVDNKIDPELLKEKPEDDQ